MVITTLRHRLDLDFFSWLCLHGKPVLEETPGRTCGPMETGAHAGSALLAGLVTPWRTQAGSVHS